MQQYQITQSPSLKLINLSVYVLVFISILTFANEIWLAGLLLLLAMLLFISDWIRSHSVEFNAPTAISLHPESGEIDIQHLDRREHFNKFTLYLNRWFLILKLRDQGVSFNYFLVGDRFESITEYLNFRRQVVKMSRDQYAA